MEVVPDLQRVDGAANIGKPFGGGEGWLVVFIGRFPEAQKELVVRFFVIPEGVGFRGEDASVGGEQGLEWGGFTGDIDHPIVIYQPLSHLFWWADIFPVLGVGSVFSGERGGKGG